MAQESSELRELSLSLDAQRLVAERLFGSSRTHDLRPYFRYYSRQCNQMASIAMTYGKPFPLATHAQLLSIIGDIRRHVQHADILRQLTEDYGTVASPEVLQNSIDLALRLLLMLDVGVFHNVYTGRGLMTWTAGAVEDFISTVPLFLGQPEIPCDGVKLESSFNVRNIEQIAGFDVQLTTNLADHLLLREDLKVVTIYHHAAFLQYHKELNAVFPAGFVEETLQTLQTIALLFPKGVKEVERWYRRKHDVEELDFASLKLGPAVRQASNLGAMVA
ncbi:Uu.00g082540.m01.CDS01 [Anthostomella pinea]|uniref:Uu.00g082540.m01.CDS01 n=1 Tax=Anthostomella pinea TaxID=933095 RepID=A0AAI8YJN1_9PEZI|nr:Uu.00g082540.m01.CDS01 [Anthostomella pinea]